MTQQADPIQQAVQYLHHQGAKGFEDIDALMVRTAADWDSCLAALTEAQAGFQPAGEWNAKQVAGHVLVTDRSINQQVAEMAGVTPPGGAVEQVRAMGQQSPEEESLPLDELRMRVRRLFDETREMASGLAASGKLDQSFPHPLFGPLNMKEWLAFHRLHAMDHIQQIEKIKADAAYPGV